jgi:RND family efflux transporter MFP subunit
VKYLQHFLIVFSSLLIIQACGNSSGDPSPSQRGNNQQNKGTSVETITAKQTDISQQIKSFGNIRAEEIVQVTPQVSNRVTKIHAQLGDTVEQGEVLAEIYAATYRDQFQQAKASMEQARATYVKDSLQFTRQQRLYQKDVISATEYEQSKATFESSKAQFHSARASLTESRENFENTNVTSPVYGVVLNRSISEGDVATTGQVAFEIANLVGYQTRVYLPLEEWRSVEIGQPVQFRVSNQPDISARGRVTQISPRLDPTTGLGEVVISLTEDAQNIYQGVLVETIINVETHKDAVVIPRAALIENVQTLIEPESNTIQLERSYSVFVVQDDTLAIQNKLKLGIEQGDRIEVLEGLQPGEQVVITGQNGLSDSTKVRVAGQPDFQQPSEIPIDNATGSNADGNTSQDTSSTS